MPAQIDDAAFAQAGVLDPLQHLAGTPPVVAEEPGPNWKEPEPCHHANENETRHSPALARNRTFFLSMFAPAQVVGKGKIDFPRDSNRLRSLIGER